MIEAKINHRIRLKYDDATFLAEIPISDIGWRKPKLIFLTLVAAGIAVGTANGAFWQTTLLKHFFLTSISLLMCVILFFALRELLWNLYGYERIEIRDGKLKNTNLLFNCSLEGTTCPLSNIRYLKPDFQEDYIMLMQAKSLFAPAYQLTVFKFQDVNDGMQDYGFGIALSRDEADELMGAMKPYLPFTAFEN